MLRRLIPSSQHRAYEHPLLLMCLVLHNHLLALCVTCPSTIVDNSELMIMGFISLGVFLTLQFGSVGSTIGFYTFEFAHIVVFFTTLIFVVQVRAQPDPGSNPQPYFVVTYCRLAPES